MFNAFFAISRLNTCQFQQGRVFGTPSVELEKELT